MSTAIGLAEWISSLEEIGDKLCLSSSSFVSPGIFVLEGLSETMPWLRSYFTNPSVDKIGRTSLLEETIPEERSARTDDHKTEETYGHTIQKNKISVTVPRAVTRQINLSKYLL